MIVEPLAANMGVVLPEEDFLPGLRKLCDREKALLIFDEVITGFRLAFEVQRKNSGASIWLPTARSSAAACRWEPTAEEKRLWRW